MTRYKLGFFLFFLFMMMTELSAQDYAVPFTSPEKGLVKIWKKYKDNWRLSEIYMEHNMLEESIGCLKKMLETKDGAPEVVQGRLNEYSYLNSFPKAVTYQYLKARHDIQLSENMPAAQQSLVDLEAGGQFPVVSFYFAGKTKNIDSVIYFCDRAASHGYVPYMIRMGNLYEFANGSSLFGPDKENASKIDKVKARYWYQQAAQAGDAEAKKRFEILDKASDTTVFRKAMAAHKAKQYKEAEYWYTIAIEGQHSSTACYNMGLVCLAAQEGNWSFNAQQYFNLAGEWGDADGYFMAGETTWRYSDGSGSRAKEFYEKAARQGHKGAVAAIQEIDAFVSGVLAERKRWAQEYNAGFNERWEKNYKGSTLNLPSGNDKPRTGCSSCGGSGKTHTTIYGGARSGSSTVFGEYSNCSACGGKGYL